MQEIRTAAAGDVITAAVLGVALLIDLAGNAQLLPDGWPVITWVLVAAVIAAGSVLALVRILRTPPGARPHGVATALLATGLLLISWLLRGHREIPPDPPLVATEAVALVLLALSLVIARRRARLPR